MSYIIIHTNNQKIARNLNRLENGEVSSRSVAHKELFEEAYNLNLLGGIGSNRKGTIKVMKNCGTSWAYISAIADKFGGDEINVFVAEPFSDAFIPKQFMKAGKWLNEKNGRKLKDVPKAMGITKEELDKYFMNNKLNMEKRNI